MTRHKCKKHEKVFFYITVKYAQKSTFPFYERLFYTNNSSSEYNNKIVFLCIVPTKNTYIHSHLTKWLYLTHKMQLCRSYNMHNNKTL